MLKWLFGKKHKRASIENPQIPLSGAMVLDKAGGNNSTLFGQITPEVALRFSAVFACIRAIADPLASCAYMTYRKSELGKERATDHYLYNLLQWQPNEFMHSQAWRNAMMFSVLLKGNGYSYIERANSGRVKSLIPIEADNVKCGVENGEKVYCVKIGKPGEEREEKLSNDEVFHIMGPSYNGIYGLSPLTYARQAITLGLAAEEYGARFFSQGTGDRGVLKAKGKLTDPVAKRLRESWEAISTGLRGAHRIAILEEGMEFQPFSISNEDAQFLVTRVHQIREVARIYRVPNHKIGDEERSTLNNIEQQNISFVTDCLTPYAVQFGMESRKLLLPSEQNNYFFKLMLDPLLAGTRKERYEAWQIARQCEWMSADDVREEEDLNRLGDGTGTTYRNPLLSQAAKTLPSVDGSGATPAPPVKPVPEDQADPGDVAPVEDGVQRALAGVIKAATIPLHDCLRRMATKEHEAIKRADNKPAPQAARAEFWCKQELTIAEALSPAVRSLACSIAALRGMDAEAAQETAATYLKVWAKEHACSGRALDETALDTEATLIAEKVLALI